MTNEVLCTHAIAPPQQLYFNFLKDSQVKFPPQFYILSLVYIGPCRVALLHFSEHPNLSDCGPWCGFQTADNHLIKPPAIFVL